MKNKELHSICKSPKLTQSIKDRINDVLEEEEAYVADELVELSECILFELASLAFATYLQQNRQKEVYNDFLIQLFNTRKNTLNAGPLFRWSANMIKDTEDEKSKKIFSLYWELKNDKKVLREKINQLSELRNDVMHGFFILPAERNQKEATNIAQLLEELISIDVFSILKGVNYHFLKTENNLTSFKGDWKIQEQEWELLNNTHSFGNLSKKIRGQLSNDFEDQQNKFLKEHSTGKSVNIEILNFINSKEQGAIANWFRPDENYNTEFSNLVNELKKDDNIVCVFHSLEKTGISHTGEFLLNRIVNKLHSIHPNEKISKNNKKALSSLRNKTEKKIIVVINNIHQSLFHPDHVIQLADYLYNNNIILVAFGICHPWLNQFFNQKISNEKEAYVPNETEWKEIFINYLRYKGPNKDINDEKKDFETLEEIVLMFLKDIKNNKILFARRFADENKLPIEYVHEIFDMLYPFFNYDQKEFELDNIDPLYDFPEELTESSRVLFSIGRRDTKLEYQHKTLSL